ncbi:LAFE_0A04852g1_1 [Lachancea fermentati]|uniref:Dolichol phosphate-mannose biosynthesis regulatory protein n=1 Tax=Lachancea fermentati TaxID=4955 RepID=A0A1G4M6Z0_LACFM|nr:LAFE_0A04852g1_1 [Lachancea fermentati]
MNKLIVLLILSCYYFIWLLLPIFDLDCELWLFPLPSSLAVILPIILLIIGTLLVGTFLGVLLLTG